MEPLSGYGIILSISKKDKDMIKKALAKVTDKMDAIDLFTIVMLAATLFLFAVIDENTTLWQDKAVEHGCGYYHPETQRFKWIDK